MRLVGYVRVSRVGRREGATFISPKVQRDTIASWAAGQHEVVEFIEDLDQPGSRADRPGLNRAMQLVREGSAQGIVVAKLNRFGRSVANQGKLVRELRESGGALFSVAEGVDTSGPTGNLIANILVAISEWELDRIREQWAEARAEAESRGVYLAEAPVGFTKTEGVLQPVPDVLSVIAGAFDKRCARESWVTIARWLDAEGIPSRRGGSWTVASVRNLIANRVYVDQGVISEATYVRANEVRGVAPARSGRASGLLSGVLRCAGCRYAMKLSQNRSRHGKPFTEYRCKSARGEAAGGRCEEPASVSSRVIEKRVMAVFWEEVGRYAMRGREAVDAVEEARRERLAAERDRDAVLDQRLIDALGGPEADAYLTLVRRHQERVDQAIAAEVTAEQEAAGATLGAMNLREVWADLPLYDQRKLLATVLDCVFVRRGDDITERTWVCRAGEAPELPVRGKRWTVQPFEFPDTAEASA
jgi:site-specific DNA recombinase